LRGIHGNRAALRTSSTRVDEASRAAHPANPGPPMSRRKQLSTTHRLVWGLTSPIQAGSTPLHRLKSSKTDCPGAMSAKAFAKSHQPTGRASGPCRNFRPHSAPKISPTSGRSRRAAGLTPAPPPAQATAPVSPGHQKSDHRGPAPGPGPAAIPLHSSAAQ
jgi:hypothetical protein